MAWINVSWIITEKSTDVSFTHYHYYPRIPNTPLYPLRSCPWVRCDMRRRRLSLGPAKDGKTRLRPSWWANIFVIGSRQFRRRSRSICSRSPGFFHQLDALADLLGRGSPRGSGGQSLRGSNLTLRIVLVELIDLFLCDQALILEADFTSSFVAVPQNEQQY